MEEIYSGKIYALYAQVALFDAESKGAYPEWETGDEEAAWGPKGVAVATANDTEVEVTVFKGKGQLNARFCTSGEIQIGNQGLIVGNVISNNIIQLAWPPGKTFVAVYVDDYQDKVTCVIFVLEELITHLLRK